ncbi:MAG: hypothetical protein SGJ13_11260 [Actinomycetota bacterium]|nr:hypothetical protein [Actinomycetota bacterium]
MDEPDLRWGKSLAIRPDAPAAYRPGEAVGVLSSLPTTGEHTDAVLVEYLVSGEHAEVPQHWLEPLETDTWFRKLGFRVVVNEDGVGGYEADFVALSSDRSATRRYGSGETRDHAIESARRRYFVEQIGSEAERRPRRPLP